MQQFGHILIILGILIAFGTGMGVQHPWLPISLALFGIFVGLVNVKVVDTNKFLITGIALEVSASAFKEFAFIGGSNVRCHDFYRWGLDGCSTSVATQYRFGHLMKIA